METKVTHILTGYDLVEKIKETVLFTEEIINKNNWQLNGDVSILKNVTVGDFENHYSKRKIKRMNRYIGWVLEKPSMSNINRFYHFICTRVLETSKRVKVIPSERELEIQAARKRWKDVQKVEQELLKRYKEVKGDFYRNRV